MKKVLFGLTTVCGAGSYAGFHFNQPLGGGVLGILALIFGGFWVFTLISSGAQQEMTGEPSE